MPPQNQPQIILFHLQASRSIRIAWLLEALGLPYTVESSPRVNGVAPPDFKAKAGGLGTSDKYDQERRLLPPPGNPKRYELLQWVHAAEGTYMVHALAVLYARWFQKDGDVARTEEGLSGNVVRDLDFLEQELGRAGEGRWLAGRSEFSVADVAMQFSVEFALTRELGTKGVEAGRWRRVLEWMGTCKGTGSWERAVERTGYEL
ncbi:hypothetical protein K431DRAFT_309001 [Polychaeton citri CBS 116435]|uniref:GST C-terminal domain-containing protein n=1 Tax=Polychaeton citri CBS 116435 TaxID=1314669 RepID=A0A9P4QI51_9PEZI|nr:hypothetical protein K431DRAFT_309001 [Polychaeton citri CBS 116435]